jgi:hypothetical protein
MMALSPLAVVEKWHNALNSGQVDELDALAHPQVEIGGPRGSAFGAQVLREWVGRANVRLLPRRWFANGNDVVVEEVGEWRSSQTGGIASSQVVASIFSVNEDGLITRIFRYDALPAALEDGCLTMEDEITGE